MFPVCVCRTGVLYTEAWTHARPCGRGLVRRCGCVVVEVSDCEQLAVGVGLDEYGVQGGDGVVVQQSTGAMELNWRLGQRCPGPSGGVETGGVVTEVEAMKLVGCPLESTPVK